LTIAQPQLQHQDDRKKSLDVTAIVNDTFVPFGRTSL